MTGTVNGVELTDGLMLIAALPMEILIAMILLSRILKYKINRWTNIIVAAIGIVSTIGTGVNDLDDIFFVTIIIVGLLAIIWLAWGWEDEQKE